MEKRKVRATKDLDEDNIEVAPLDKSRMPQVLVKALYIESFQLGILVLFLSHSQELFFGELNHGEEKLSAFPIWSRAHYRTAQLWSKMLQKSVILAVLI